MVLASLDPSAFEDRKCRAKTYGSFTKVLLGFLV